MTEKQAESKDVAESRASAPEVNYAPRKHSMGDQIIFSLMLLAIGFTIFLMFYLME